VSDPVAVALAEALEPLVRRLVREEVSRASPQWPWRTPAQAGALLGISAAAVRQRVLRGQLPATKLEGRIYVDVRDVDAAIRNGRYDGRPLHIDQAMGAARLAPPTPRTQED
jgi:Helix-turn-helix domain